MSAAVSSTLTLSQLRSNHRNDPHQDDQVSESPICHGHCGHGGNGTFVVLEAVRKDWSSHTVWHQDEYSRLSRNASVGVHGYALVFSMVSRQSFEIIQTVNDSLLNTLGDAPDVPRILVGSMCDLAENRQVSQEVSGERHYLERLSHVFPRTPKNWPMPGAFPTWNARARRAKMYPMSFTHC